MKKILLTALALAFIASPALAAPEIGKPAPDFTAAGIDGKPFKLSDHKGKIVILEWTNHECPFVQKHYDTGNMQKTQAAAHEKGAEWVSIVSSSPDRQGYVTPEQAKKIVEDAKASPDVKILDESGTIGKLYEAKTTPHMFVIGTDGNIAYMGAIDDNSSPRHETVEGAKNYVLGAVDSLVAGTAVETSTTQPYGCNVKYAD